MDQLRIYKSSVTTEGDGGGSAMISCVVEMMKRHLPLHDGYKTIASTPQSGAFD
jgi:hypothetical protein